MNDRFFSKNNALLRLKKEYEIYGNLFIAVDFDHTLYDFDNVGDTYPLMINEIKRASDLNLCIILYTCREGEKLEEAKKYCEDLGINITYYNENPVLNTRKIYYSLFLDDRAGLGQSFEILHELNNYLTNLKNI